MNLQKMSMRGIRSFGPSDTDVQSITFLTPVTLIVGPNGTGKTTVIECLRYCSTGEMPAGSKQGASFVHDLKLAETTEVRAQVRLGFIDIKGKLINVQRSLSASIPLKGKQVSLRTLENAISRVDQEGNVCQISSKCADVDREIVECLGVSKAILENVIFCHQEDCNWPLSEGKVVKAKFDDIFATTKYVKALEELRKIRMEKNHQYKMSSMELVHLRRNRDRADEIKKQIRDDELKISSADNELSKIEVIIIEKKPILESSNAQIKMYHESHEKIQRLRSEKLLLETQMNELLKIIEGSPFDVFCDTRELFEIHEKKINQHKEKLGSYGASIADLQRSKSEFSAKVDRTYRQLQSLECHSMNMRDLKLKLEENKAKSAKIIKQVVGDRGGDYRRVLAEKEAAAVSEGRLIGEEYEECSGRKCSAQHQLNLYKQRKAQIDDQLKSIDESLAASRTSASLIAKIDSQLMEMTAELEKLNEESEDRLKSELESNLRDKEGKVLELDECELQMQSAMKNQQIRCEIEVAQKNINQKTTHLENLMETRSKDLKKLLKTDPKSDTVAKQVSEAITSRAQELANLSQNDQLESNNVATLKSRLEMQKEQLENRKSAISAMTDRLSQAGLSQMDNLEETFGSLYDTKSTELRSKQDDKGFSLGVEKTYSKFIEKIERADSCPLCHREFSEAAEKEDLIDEMKQTISSMPATKTRLDAEIEALTEEFNQIVSLKPIVHRFTDEKKVLENAEEGVNSTSKDLSESTKRLNQSRSILNSKRKEIDSLHALNADVSAIDALSKEISASTLNLEKLQSRISDSGSPKKTLKQVQDERTRIQASINELSVRIEGLRADISQKEHRRLYLTGEIEKSKNKRLVIISESSNVQSLSEKRSGLLKEVDGLKSEILKVEKELEQLSAKCEQIAMSKTAVMNEIQKVSLENSRIIHDIDSLDAWIRDSESKIAHYTNDTLPQLAKLEKELEFMRKELAITDEEILAKQRLLDCQREEAVNLEREKRIISDITAYQSRRKRFEKLKDEIDSFPGCDVDLTSLLEHEKRLQIEYRDIISTQQRLKMTVETHKSQLQKAKKQLSEPSLVTANENFVECAVNVRACEVVCADLDKLYFALDRSIMSFHTAKMQELNKIIRRLWQSTYRGSDIDYIEIRSEMDSQSGGFVKRRNYNYKVVMVCNRTAIEMRYRCSAGQKVLASLIIRLALAEAFGTECGIIALDEPTTNLDRENIESLACSLIGLIQSRRAQKNFQLIIITHDEDFVEILGRSQCVEHFYRIHKNSRNLSVIKKCNVEELN